MAQRTTHLIGLVALLLLAALLRVHGLSQMTNMLHHDEAYNGIDAVSLLQNPRLTVYFPNNTGREGLWMILLAPSIAIFGATPFALRLVSVFVGILSVAAVYPLAREFFGRHGAVWAVGAMAVLYWPMHLSHIAFRANLFPLVGSLAMAALLKARRTKRGWITAGGWIGLLLYTYIAARVWVAYAGIWLLLWGLQTFFEKKHHQAKGVFIALIVAGFISLPLVLVLFSAKENADHIESMFVPDKAYLVDNIRNWIDAWLIDGDPITTHNYNSRPVLDVPLALLTAVGIVTFWWMIRRKWLLIWWVGLVAVSLIPTIIAIQTPHFLRGLGLVIPLVLLTGAGGAFLNDEVKGLAHYIPAKLLVTITVLLLCWSGLNSYRDFEKWLNKDEPLAIYIDDRFNDSMAIVREQTPPTMPIMIPGIRYHPVAAFHGYGMPQRETFFYEWSDGECYVTPRQPYVAVDLPIYLNRFEWRVQPYSASVTVIARQPEQEYNVFSVTPHDDLMNDWNSSVLIGASLEVQVVEPVPDIIAAGDMLTFNLGMRVHQTFTQEYRFFVHLQGDPTPYAGGTQFSSGDTPLCEQVYNPQWDISETIVQTLTLPIPDDIPAGTYHVAIGLYDPTDGTRLPITPEQNEHRYFEAFRFVVE